MKKGAYLLRSHPFLTLGFMSFRTRVFFVLVLCDIQFLLLSLRPPIWFLFCSFLLSSGLT